MAFGSEQTIPQPAQLAASARTLTSQPSEASPLQSAQPLAQLPSVQRPPAQLTPAWFDMHASPHIPQFIGSLPGSVQPPLQHFIPPPQRLSSVQPGTHAVTAPSVLQILPVGQSASATQATQTPSRQMGV